MPNVKQNMNYCIFLHKFTLQLYLKKWKSWLKKENINIVRYSYLMGYDILKMFKIRKRK